MPSGSSKVASSQKHTAPRGDYKMVLVVRNDLKMGKGEILDMQIAQFLEIILSDLR